MTRYAVIADDFTGAGDSGIHFAAAGLRSALVLDGSGIADAFRDHDAVAFSTESRFLPPDRAAGMVRDAVRSCRGAGAEVFFKKIDSTLRGNLASETRTVMREGGYAAAVVCPAMPKTGRTVGEGRLLVHGVPVDETELGRDPFNPVPSASIRDLLPGWACGALPLAALRGGVAPAAERIRKLAADGCEAIVADAASDEDLAILGAALRLGTVEEDLRILPVGAGGLAEAFVGAAEEIKPVMSSGRLLAVVGSLTSASAAQIAQAKESGMFTLLELDMERARSAREDEIVRLAARAASDRGTHLLLVNACPPGKEDAGGVSREDGLFAASVFGLAAREIAARASCSRLYVTGGSTAVAVARALGICSVTLERECMPGVVLSSCRTDYAPVRWFITKAGGFGLPDTLVRLV